MMIKDKLSAIRFILSCILCILFAQQGWSKIEYPDFDQSMLRTGLSLNRINPDFDIECKANYAERNQDLITFFRELYNRNIQEVASEESKLRIPRIVHQIWLGSPVPERFYKWMDTWRLEGWEYKLWTDAEVENLFLHNRSLYEESVNFGEKADILRLEILSQFGGVYADIDFECLKPEIFEELHHSFDFYIGFEPLEHGYTNKFNMFKVCNALIAAAPGHSLILDLILNLRANYFAYRDCCSAIQRTGPSYLTRIICEYEQSGAHNQRNMYLPCTFFYPMNEPEIQFLFQHPGTPAFILPETAGLHYWCGTWWRSNPFLDFILKLDSTYLLQP